VSLSVNKTQILREV